MFHPANIIFMILFEIALILLSVFVWQIVPWAVCTAFTFAIWVTALVALSRNRQLKSEHQQGFIVTDRLQGQFVQNRFVVSHKHLDLVRVPLIQMITIFVVLASLFLCKCVYQYIATAASPYSGELYVVFCILPDLAFTVIVSTHGTIDLFETSQYQVMSEPDIESDLELQHKAHPNDTIQTAH